MEFCPKCGGMMAVKTEKGKKKLVCRRCGFSKDASSGRHVIEEKIKRKPMDDVVMIKEEDTKSLPTVKIKCSKCGNDEAVWWIKQMRSGDEPPTIFYRCTKCKHTWRQY
ncbi:MAG: transcription factor S [Candidatus Micrarchaeota archaeon]|nr:transcription factor S [Candidatus Micrarchaeota archaeon]